MKSQRERDRGVNSFLYLSKLPSPLSLPCSARTCKWLTWYPFPHCNFLMIWNKPIIAGEITGSRFVFSSVQFSTPGLPVHHQLPESTQTHGHWVGDVFQPSHPLSSPTPPALNLSQHQGLLKWVISLHEVAKVLEFQLQHQSFQWTPRTHLL